MKILFTIHLLSDSKHLPCTCKHLNAVFKQATPTHRAKYIIARHNATLHFRSRRCRYAYFLSYSLSRRNIVTFALKFRMCDEATLKVMVNMKDCPITVGNSYFILPRWLFRNLENNATTECGHPLPLLRFLFNQNRANSCPTLRGCRPGIVGRFQSVRNILPRPIPIPDVDSYNGYPLVRAVRANHIPLIQFLLDHGATATHVDFLALREAIRKRDLNLVKMLIEKDTGDQDVNENGKRSRAEDRIVVTQKILEKAVNEGLKAREIVKYFVEEKGVKPDRLVQEKINKKRFFKDATITRRRVASRK